MKNKFVSVLFFVLFFGTSCEKDSTGHLDIDKSVEFLDPRGFLDDFQAIDKDAFAYEGSVVDEEKVRQIQSAILRQDDFSPETFLKTNGFPAWGTVIEIMVGPVIFLFYQSLL